MELQWPLIIFTTLLSWSAGLFAAQCACALKGEGTRAQMPAWILAAGLLVVGGVAVFFHLEHWERIFNGFGHLSSGITQELIGIVVLAIVAVVYLAFLRKDATPKWLAAAGIVAAAALVFVMGHSYMMAARPAWDSWFGVLSLLGAACAMGPATMAALIAKFDGSDEQGEKPRFAGAASLAGNAVNAATTAAYVAAMALASASFANVGNYFDPTHPTYGMTDLSALSPFSGDALAMTAMAIVLAVAGLVCAFIGKKQDRQLVWGSAAVVCAFAGTVLLRVTFYIMGASVFMFY